MPIPKPERTKYTINGNAGGNQSQGRFVDPQTQGGMNYEASLKGDELTLTIQNPANGQFTQLQFRRWLAALLSLHHQWPEPADAIRRWLQAAMESDGLPPLAS